MSEKGPKFEKKRKEIHPSGAWTCPFCGAKHKHPHWEDHHQTQKVDKNFCDDFCKESDSQHEIDDTGLPKPLFCPKCSWREDRLVIVKIEKGDIIYA